MLDAALSTSSVVTRLILGMPCASPRARVESSPVPTEEVARGRFAVQFQAIGETNPLQTT